MTFYFENGHVVITFPNGIEVSMCNYDGAHCTPRNRMPSKYSPCRTDTVEVMVRQEIIGKDLINLTSDFFKDASPDAANVTLDQILDLFQKVRGLNKQPLSQKCDFPSCQKDASIHFTTRDGISHKYCSVEHTNDHRNILIMGLMK